MTSNHRKSCRKRLFAGLPLLAISVAWGATATEKATDIQSWLELGGGVVHNGNGRFGEYSNLYQSDRLFGLAAFGIDWRDSADPYRYGNLSAISGVDQLGLEAALARQGDYRIGFDYRRFEAVSREDVNTVFATRGSDHRLPPGYTGVSSAQRFNTHAGVSREGVALDLMRQLGQWQLSARLNSELKEGSKVTGASERFGDATLLLAPVDYRHDTITLGSAYEAQQWRVNTAWYHSRFRNDQRALSYQNPINLNAPLRTLDTGPDNEFTRISADGLYRLSTTSQVSFYAAHGDGRQNDDWLQPVLVAGQPLLDSLDARRVDTDLRIGFRAQPSARLGYRLQWDYRERDNRTDVIQLSPTGYSHLYDSTRQRLALDGSYRLPKRMRLRGGVELIDIERTSKSLTRFSDDVDDTRLWAELRLPAIGQLNWSLGVETTDRDSDLSAQRTAALNVGAPSQALPDYLLAGRNWQYRLQGDLPLSDTVMATASYRYVKDDFDNDYYGLRRRTSDELSANLSWQARQNLALSLWGLYQDFHLSQDGREFNPTSAPSHANAPWRQQADDSSRSAGVNLRWRIKPALEATMDYSLSDNDSSYRSRWLEDADTGEAAGTRDRLPGVGVDVQRLQAALDWDRSPRTRYQLRYLYQRMRSSDWAWGDDKFNALAFGWNSPNYDAHALMVTVKYQWDKAR